MPSSEQGFTQNRWSLIPRVLVFLIHSDEVLLIKGNPQKGIWASKFNGIGGHIEQGENILAAARRELLEETGLTCFDLSLCGIITVDTGHNPGVGIYVFTGYSFTGVLHSSPEGDPYWIKIKELGNLYLVEDVPLILAHIIDKLPYSQIFFATTSYDDNGRMTISFLE